MPIDSSRHIRHGRTRSWSFGLCPTLFEPTRSAMTPTMSTTCWLSITVGLQVCLLAGCQRGATDAPKESDSHTTVQIVTGQYPVEIRQPPIPRGVPTNALALDAQPVSLQCYSCHSVRPANSKASRSTDMDEFHQGLHMSHGQLACVSCHNPTDGYSTLRLADGRSVAFTESMSLCAQCHGTQFRDYQHGAHGGMTGHWDLKKGGRTRNHCLHCHDPHAPKYPTFMPVAAPHDRFPPAAVGEFHE